MTELRIARILLDDGTWKEVSFRDLKRGDRFMLIESNGELVEDGKTFCAQSDAFDPGNENGRWAIQVYT